MWHYMYGMHKDIFGQIYTKQYTQDNILVYEQENDENDEWELVEIIISELFVLDLRFMTKPYDWTYFYKKCISQFFLINNYMKRFREVQEGFGMTCQECQI